MTKSIKILIITLGVLSILSGIYLAVVSSDIVEVTSAFFAGLALIIAALYFDKKPNPDADL